MQRLQRHGLNGQQNRQETSAAMKCNKVAKPWENVTSTYDSVFVRAFREGYLEVQHLTTFL